MSRGNVEREIWCIFGTLRYLNLHDSLKYRYDQAGHHIYDIPLEETQNLIAVIRPT